MVSSRAWRALRNVAREPEILAEFGTNTITATLQAVIDKVVLEEVPVLKRIIRQRRGLEPTGASTIPCLHRAYDRILLNNKGWKRQS